MSKLTAKGNAAIWLGVLVFVLDFIAVLLRLFARRSKRISLRADDYLIILAVPLEFTYITILLWGVIGGGGGLSIFEITVPEVTLLLKAQYIGAFFINTICTVVKLSILCLYSRVFDVSNQFHTASQVVRNLCIAWYIVATCFAIIPCQPINAAWVVGPEGPYPADHCINFPVYFVCIEVTNVVLDVMIICLPVHMIRRLHLPNRQKIYLSGIFLLGGFVIIAGLLRIAVIYRPGKNLSLILLTHFSIVETGVAIICACLPTYRPLLAYSSPLFDRLKQWYSSRKLTRSSTTAFPGRRSDTTSQFNKMGDLSSNNEHFAEAVGVSRRSGGSDAEGYPLGTISVNDTVRLSYHDK